LILMTNAPTISKSNFTALTRLDHNRATSMIAKKAGAAVGDVKDIIIWGNHSSTQVPDIDHATIKGAPARAAVNDDAFVNGEFIKNVQQRGAAVIAARKLSSAASAARAITDHMHDWFCGSDGNIVSMAVSSDGNPYGVKEGLIFSFPVKCLPGGKYEIVKGLKISPFYQKLIKETEKELCEEKDMSKEYLS